ncbi:MAG: PqiC family protein [Deltaproteobacteria bacterium]|nr:PqiC family protein [Deltaproteobacteria bacterium]
MMFRITMITFLCALGALTTGCASTPKSRFYTLSATAAPVATTSTLSVIVGPVSVPAVVDRPQIVVDMGANQVRLEDFNRWAEPLQNNIARVVADNLVQMLGTPRVNLLAQTSSTNSDYRAAVDVQSFQSAPGKAAMLDAIWTVRRTTDDKSKTGRTTVREAIQQNGREKAYDALAAAHSRAVARLSQDIADAVRAIEGSGK